MISLLGSGVGRGHAFYLDGVDRALAARGAADSVLGLVACVSSTGERSTGTGSKRRGKPSRDCRLGGVWASAVLACAFQPTRE